MKKKKSRKSTSRSMAMVSIAVRNLVNMAVVVTVAGTVLLCLVVASKWS